MDNKSQLLDIARNRYGNEDIATAVVADAEKHGTIDRIIDGDLNLPGKHDATHWYNRERGIVNPTATESAQQLTIQDLQRRLRLLEDQSGNNAPAPAVDNSNTPL